MENKQEEQEVLGHNKGYSLISIMQAQWNKLWHFNISRESIICVGSRGSKKEKSIILCIRNVQKARERGKTEWLEMKQRNSKTLLKITEWGGGWCCVLEELLGVSWGYEVVVIKDFILPGYLLSEKLKANKTNPNNIAQNSTKCSSSSWNVFGQLFVLKY